MITQLTERDWQKIVDSEEVSNYLAFVGQVYSEVTTTLLEETTPDETLKLKEKARTLKFVMELPADELKLAQEARMKIEKEERDANTVRSGPKWFRRKRATA